MTSLKRVHEDAADGQVWRGIGVSSGRVTAVARAIRHPDEGTRLDHGEILLAPSTDPGWTPLFLRASAMVMETGGYLSHGVIVAREYGLPAVVNIPGLLNHIKDGETLAVDGDAATVRCMLPPTTIVHHQGRKEITDDSGVRSGQGQFTPTAERCNRL